MNRHSARVQLVFALYQHLLLGKELDRCFADNFNDVEDEFITCLCNELIDNIDTYKEQIGSRLNRWTFDRLNLVEQAIILEAVSEIRLGLNDTAVVIDEAVILSKQYCDEESYKYINGVLDNL